MEKKVIEELNHNWVWASEWVDSSQNDNTAGRLVTFSRVVKCSNNPISAVLHISADTRYKLLINGKRICIGPTRGSPYLWFYDTVDIAPYLVTGSNVVEIVVLRFFAANRAAMPFGRTSFPGLTVFGTLSFKDEDLIRLDTSDCNAWNVVVDETTAFPTGLIDDGFLHIYERVNRLLKTRKAGTAVCRPYGFRTLNGDLLPWRLRPRLIPMPEETNLHIQAVRRCEQAGSLSEWRDFFVKSQCISLAAHSKHVVEVQAEVHSTAFVEWKFASEADTIVRLSVTYSEGYELESRSYPFFRSKADRLDAAAGSIVGPRDEAHILVRAGETTTYAPFWFRTFLLLRICIEIGDHPVQLVCFDATQTNYPLAVEAEVHDDRDPQCEEIFDVSIRTLRNCMFDGYSDCPFYEQLQYSMDSRAVGLFHYLISGDDRLIRQTLVSFAASTTAEGLTQSRFPSHVNQLIAGFPLYFILQVCDHHLFFGDTNFSRTFVPRIDSILDFFDQYVDDHGLISGLPADVWQFVDWVTTWHATDEHPDKGVPTAGRQANLHTYFSMLLSYVLQHAAKFLRDVGRPGNADEYTVRSEALNRAVREFCFDGALFTDSTADIARAPLDYSQHCQVFAVLCGAAKPGERKALLERAFTQESRMSKCSYMMQFYAFRAFAAAGDELYENYFPRALQPWRDMLANNLTTWEEDDVRQRSDCHAWGSVPVYEYCTELAGIQVLKAGCSKILFKPRLNLSAGFKARVALGKDNVAAVSWEETADGWFGVLLELTHPVQVVSRLPGRMDVQHGTTRTVALRFRKKE